jgi:type IV secretory pathway TrbD component
MNMKMFAAAAIGVALFVWTIASVGIATLAVQINQLGIMLPLVMALAAVRFVLQAAGWRIAMGSTSRPSLVQAVRAVIAGEAAGYLTWGPISREPVKALMVSEHTPERISLSAAIVERIAYMGAATGLVIFSLILVAVRVNRTDWIAPGFVAAILIAVAWMAVRRKKTGPNPSRPRFSRPALAALVVFAIAQEIINVIETYVVLAWLGAGPTVESAVALEGLNRLANAPAQLIPGKLGVLELAGSAFAGILHLGTANGLTLVLARRVRSLAWTGVGILLLTTSASRVRARRDPAIV